MNTMFDMIENNPFYKVFWLLLIGAVVFVVVRIVQRYVFALVKDDFQLSLIRRWEFRAITLIWLIYGSWAMYHLIKSNFIVTLTILAVVMVFGWRNWMEFFTGIFLRLEQRIERGDILQTAEGSGKVEGFYFQSIGLQSTEGYITYLPYSRVTNDVVVQRTDQQKLMAQSFEVHVASNNPHKVKEVITELVYFCPWTAVLHPVNVAHTTDETYLVTARTINQSDFSRLEAFVLKRLRKIKIG